MGRAVRWGIAALWVGLVAVLLQRQWNPVPEAEPLAVAATRGAPSAEEWMGMYHKAQKIGYVHLSVFPDDKGYSVEEESFLRMTILDTPQTVRMRVTARAAEDHSLQSLAFKLDSGSGTFRVDGERQNDELRLQTSVGGDESEIRIPAERSLFLPASIRRLLVGAGLEPGKRYELQVFDPSMMKAQPMVASVVGQEEVPGTAGLRGWRIEEEYSGIKSVAWLDGDGHVLREEGPMGLVLVRETPEVATAGNWSEGTALDLVASVSIPVDPPLASTATLERLDLRVSGIELDLVPSDDRQALKGDLLSVHREAIPASASYSLPYAAEDRREDLAPTALLQVEHPRVQSAAREAVGSETDPVAATRRLASWVHGKLRKVPTVSVPNALQVLDMGEGDCNEHAVLFAALARAVGLPARVAAGVVYANGAFQYHAWNEVWLGRWVSVDPVFDQFPADPSHVKFVTGGPEDHLAMIAVIGRLGLEVVEAN